MSPAPWRDQALRILQQEPSVQALPLTELNQRAVAHYRAGDFEGCAAIYDIFELKREEEHLTHEDLHVALCNWASALCSLSAPEPLLALDLARRAEQHVREGLARLMPTGRAPQALVMCLTRQAQALVLLERPHEALKCCEDALRLVPDSEKARELHQRASLQLAEAGLQATGLSGGGKRSGSSKALLTAPEPEGSDGVPSLEGRSEEAEPGPESDSALAAIEAESESLQGWRPGPRPVPILPAASPMAKIRENPDLPRALLHPLQAEHDDRIRESLNFVLIRTDMRKPKEAVYHVLTDTRRFDLFSRAVRETVAHMDAELAMDPRVLHVGCGAGVLAVQALRDGAKHVTCVDRWLYLALSCKEVLDLNKAPREAYSVLHRRATDLKLHTDVPLPSNLLLLDGLLDPSLLLTGIIPSVNHCIREGLVIGDFRAIPMTATVYVQPIEVVPSPYLPGLPVAEAAAAAAADLPLGMAPIRVPRTPRELEQLRAAVRPLGAPVEAWTFRLTEENAHGHRLDLQCPASRPGTATALLIFYRMKLTETIEAASWSPALLDAAVSSDKLEEIIESDNVLRSLGAAAQPLPRGIPLVTGQTLHVAAAHNTCKMRFEAAAGAAPAALAPPAPTDGPGGTTSSIVTSPSPSLELALIQPGARKAGRPASRVLPNGLLRTPRCPEKLAAYEAGIRAAVSSAPNLTAGEGEGHPGLTVLDLASGSGALALLAKRAAEEAGRTPVRVLGVELMEGVVGALRRGAAQGGDAEGITVVHRDVSLLKLGQGVPVASPPGLLTLDLFDSGLGGLGAVPLMRTLELRQIVQEGCHVVPAAATLYCVGLEVRLPTVGGGSGTAPDSADSKKPIKISPLRRFLWGSSYETVSLLDLPPYTVLTRPSKVFSASLGPGGGPGVAGQKDSFVKMEAVTAGELNAVALWFELDMGGGAVLSSAPPEFLVLLPEEAAAAAKPQAQAQAPQATQAQATDSPSDIPSKAAPEDGQSQSQAAASAEPPSKQYYYTDSYGQGLQYLDRSLGVVEGARFSLVARREGQKMTFSLRPGLGQWVERAEWLEEWGGGVSVENPHVQRFKYTGLITTEFLQRSKAARFPSIEGELAVLAAHCGSLQLDPWALDDVARELVLLETVQQASNFGPLAQVEGLVEGRWDRGVAGMRF